MNAPTKVKFGRRVIDYELGYSGRNTLAIHVLPDQSVSVVAPHDTPFEDIHSRVQKRAPWIAKQQDHFEKFLPLPMPSSFVSGETHLYLGRQYRLKIRKSHDTFIKLKSGFIHIETPDKSDRDTVEAVLMNWYRERAQDHFARRLDNCLGGARSLNIDNPGFSIRKMTRRWGSCTKSGRILLNLQLVKTPGYCIEYVIMHELCHLRIHNHGPEFYRLLSRCMPDWERRKEKLAGCFV